MDERLKKSNEPLTWPSLDEANSSQDEQSSPEGKDAPLQLEAVVVEKDTSAKIETAPSPDLSPQPNSQKVVTV